MDQMEQAFLAFGRNVDMVCGYRPRPVVAPTLLVWAVRSPNGAGEPDWARLLPGGVRRVSVHADHHTLLSPPAVGDVAGAIRARLR